MVYFPKIEKIKYEGTNTKNMYAFRHYNPEEIIMGKTMKEHLRFAVAYWHTMTQDGSDTFGKAVNKRGWLGDSPMETAKKRVIAFFEILEKLDVEYFCFHDIDIAPEGNSLKEFFSNIDEITDLIKEKMDETGIKLLWNTANMFSNPRYVNGAASTNNANENTAIESKALTRAIERAQKGVEGKNFEIRKNVLKYDDTINEQRKVIYNERNKVLNDEDIQEDIQKMVKDIIQEAGETYLIGRKRDYYGYFKHLYSTFMPADTLLIPGVDKKSVQEIIDSTYEISKRVYDLKKMMLGIDKVAELEKTVLLKVVDQYWIDHIDAMEQLKQYIGLKSYAQKDPFKEYALEGYDMFEALNKNIREATVQYLYKFN